MKWYYKQVLNPSVIPYPSALKVRQLDVPFLDIVQKILQQECISLEC